MDITTASIRQGIESIRCLTYSAVDLKPQVSAKELRGYLACPERQGGTSPQVSAKELRAAHRHCISCCLHAASIRQGIESYYWCYLEVGYRVPSIRQGIERNLSPVVP